MRGLLCALLAAIGLGQAPPLAAQSLEVVYLPYRPASARADADLSTARIRATFLNLNVPLPALRRGSRMRLVPELTVQHLNVDAREWSEAPIDRVTRAGLTLRMERRVGRNGLLLAALSTMSDFNAVDALLVYVRDVRPLAWGLGAARNVALDAELPIPVIYLRYSDGITTSGELLFPAHAEAWFRPAEHLSIGFAARLRIARFDGHDDTLVDHGEFSVAPALRWHFLPGLVLQWEAGLTAGRVFDVRKDGTVLRRLAPEDAAFVTLRVGIGPSS